MKKKYFRDITQIAKDDMSLLDPESPAAIMPEVMFSENVRLKAIGEVLRRLPERDYQKLKEVIVNITWFIPALEDDARVLTFPATIYPSDGSEKEAEAPYTRVIYLAASLEKNSFDIVVGTVAHELAHLILEHDPFSEPDFEGDYVRNEYEAYDKAKEMGFEKETKKMVAQIKRIETLARNPERFLKKWEKINSIS